MASLSPRTLFKHCSELTTTCLIAMCKCELFSAGNIKTIVIAAISIRIEFKEAAMARQGCAFSETEIDKIIDLLSRDDMSIAEIAARMQCSRSAVAGINRKFQVRFY